MRMRRGRLKKKTSDGDGGAAPEKPPTRSWRRIALVVACACAAEVLSCRRRVPAPAGFDAARAATHAKVLASLGPRTVGERALDAGLAYALREARRVPDAEVEEWRSGRGAVDHAQFLGGFVGVYDDVACVVARLKGRAEGKGAVLLNAHIDSAANAPGASDDLLAVGVLLEALRYFATHRPARDIIVLINGAEETHQLAAHAFATQHPAAEDVRFVVNLESMGSGGREFIFRCAGEDVALALRGTTQARGSVLAEELFRAVLWRAARTDYAEFLRALPRAGVGGVDVAFLEDGYAYHTSQDRRVSLQSTGSEAATLVDIVERLEGVDDDAEVTHGFVFFDLLGVVVVGYSATVARCLHGAAALAGAVEARRRAGSPAEALHAFGRAARAVSAAALAAAAFGAVLSLLAPMRWYAGGVPAALVLFMPPAAFVGTDEDALALWSLVCGLGALFNIGAAYAACAAVLGLLVAPLRPVALVVWIQIAHTLLGVAVPLLGRVGSRVPLDAAVGALVGILAGLIRTLTPPWPRRPNKRVCFSVLAGLLVAACAAPAFTAARPKRLALQHVSRDLDISRDSGLWVIPLDGSRLRGLGRALGRATPVACDKLRPSCYLEFPWFFPFADIVRGDVWLDAPPPDLAGDKPASLALARNGDAVDVSVEGPSHMHVVLRGNVHGWSFAGVKRAPEPRRRAEGVYLAQLTCGRARCSFRISVRVDGPLEVSLAAHRPVLTTEALEGLRRELPSWAVGAEWGKFASELVLRSV